MNQIKLLAIGSDPEVFFIDKNDTPHSAEGLIGGTKARPKEMKGLPLGFFIQEDNVAAEFNIPPATSAKEFAENILQGLKFVEGVAASKGMKVRCAPCLDFPEEQLKTRHARTLGCDPDVNIWLNALNETPEPPEKMRTAAGHVHISWQEPKTDQRIVMGKLCDLFLGVPSILVTEPSERRKLYGRAGACRLKSYGIEYRTLDNFWIPKKAYSERVFSNIDLAIQRINYQANPLIDALEDFSEEIQMTINDHSISMARVLMERFAVPGFQ